MKNLRLKEVFNIKEVEFSSEIAKQVARQYRKQASENSKYIKAFTFKYKSLGNYIGGFLVAPKNIKNIKNTPFVIYNRGGTKDFGSVAERKLFLLISDIAKEGYIVIGSQYPGNSFSEGKDEWGGNDLQSILDLYPLIKKISGNNKPLVGMWGGSRGGMMTYLCLTKVKWIKAAVVESGTSNLLRGAKLRPEMQKVFEEAFGGSVAEKRKRSAVFFADKISKKTPILIMHGTGDWRVSPLDALELSEKLYTNKVPHRLVIFEGADHFLSEFRKEATDSTKKWFDAYLKKNNPLPDLKPHGK